MAGTVIYIDSHFVYDGTAANNRVDIISTGAKFYQSHGPVTIEPDEHGEPGWSLVHTYTYSGEGTFLGFSTSSSATSPDSGMAIGDSINYGGSDGAINLYSVKEVTHVAEISKITLPSGNTYDIKDATARAAIAGGVSFIIAWNGTSTPVIADIPAGVTVTYNNTTYTGTLDADDAQAGAFYLVKSTTQAGSTLDVYDEYVPVGTTGSKTWEKIGDTQLDLTDVVTGVTLNKQTDTVIGSDATFTITQPTVALSTGATAGDGVISVATGITSVTQPTVALSAESSSATGRTQYVQSVSTTKAKASASGGNVAWNSKDSKTVLTGVQVTAQPTVTLTANGSTGTGRITYVESQGTATTTKISASADITGKTGSAASSVTPTTKKLATTTITGVSGSTNITPIESRTSQTTADGTGTASTTNTDWLKGVSVSNETLVIGAATLDTQTTYSAGAPRASLAVPTAAGSATRVATGSVNTTDSNGADIVTDVAVGDTVTVVTAAPTVTISSGSTGDVTVATGIGTATTKYMSASASGTTVGSNGTASVIGADSTFTVTQPSVTLATDTNGDITIATGGTTKYMAAAASGAAVTPTTTNIKATATGANTQWNSKDQVTVLTNSTDVSVTKGNS